MRTEQKTFTYYSFDELTEEAKERAIQDYINTGLPNDDFYYYVSYDLGEVFDDVKCQYSLSYCQGDGFNSYGTASADEIFKAIDYFNISVPAELSFSEKEKRAAAFYQVTDIIIPMNRRYCYSYADYIEFADEWIYELEENYCYKNINEGLIYRFEQLCRFVFAEIDNHFEKLGYEMIYNISETDFSELSEANGWEYLASGASA